MSKKIISSLITVCMIFSTFAFNVFAQSNLVQQSSIKSINTPDIIKNSPRNPGQLIVKYKKNSSFNSTSNCIIKNDGKILETSKNGLTLIEVDDSKITEKMDILKQDKNVEYIVPNYIRKATGFPADAPNDPEFKNQWGLQNINAQQAWTKLAEATSLNEVKVAVIDTGIDMSHQDLKDRISPDGYDFVDMDSDPTYGPVNEEHASHVAGIIAASTDNGLGVSGTSGKVPVKIMPLRVLRAGSGDDYTIAQAINYAADNGARVINMSLGGSMESPALNEAVNYALSKNVVVVAAAGNSSMDAANFYPAAIPGVITVSATDISNAPAYFSNYGSVVELAAPGVNVLSTIPENKYEYFDGTSMSAPFISAACALLISRNPSLSNTEVEQYLTDSAKDLGPAGKDESFGYGLLDLAKALNTTEIKPRLEIMNLSGNSNVFGLINVQTRFTYPQNLITTELLIDGSVIESIYNDSNNIFNNFEIDTNKFNDGTHTLKVVANDKFNKSYSKEIKVNIKNTVYTGLMVKLSHDGAQIKSGFIEVLNKFTDSDGKTYYDYVYGSQISKTGVTVIPGSSAPNGNEYVLIATYVFDKGNGYETAYLIKEAVAPGVIEMNGKDLVPVTIDTGLDSADQDVFANYKFPGSNENLEFPISVTASAGKFKAYLNPGTYSFGAFTYYPGRDGEEKPIYILKSEDIEIDSDNFFVTLDSDIENLAKIDLSYESIHGFLPQSAYLSIDLHEDSTLSNSITINNFADLPEIYATPGSYSYILQVLGQKDNQESLIVLEGSLNDLEAGSEDVLAFGGTFTGKIGTDKAKFIPGEEVTVNASVTDNYGNRLRNMFYFPNNPLAGILGKKTFSYKSGANKIGFKVTDTSFRALEDPVNPVEPEKPIIIELKSPGNIDLVDSKNNVALSIPLRSVNNIYFRVPQGLATGNYKLKMVLELPYLIQAEKALSVSRVIKKDATKLTVELPGNEKATIASVEAINTSTGKSYYSAGENLLNGEIFIALPKGSYTFIVTTKSSDGKPVIYVKDAKSPAEYNLTPDQLQNVKFTVKDEEGKTINKPSNFYFLIPEAKTAYTYTLARNEAAEAAEANFYISRGTYNLGAEILSPSSYIPERIIFKENVAIGLITSTLQTEEFTSDNLTEVSLDSNSEAKNIAVMINEPETGFTSSFELTKDKSVKVSKGLYNLEMLCAISEYGNTYSYIMSSQKDFSGAQTCINCGTDFSISITPNKAKYKAGEAIKTQNIISDRFGNRVTQIMGYSSSDFMSEKIQSSKGRLTLRKDGDKFKLFDVVSGETVVIPYYDIRAPFMYIKDSFGDVVFSAKSPDFYTGSKIKLDPKWANSGDYKIELTVDIDADGNLSGQSSFKIK